MKSLAVILGCVAACDSRSAPEITLVEGATVTRLATHSAFAEYVELGVRGKELRITLASHPLSCERWVPPGKGDSAVTVVIVVPRDQALGPGTYGWVGIPAAGEPLSAYALPKVQLGAKSRLFEPGGGVTLSHVQLEPRGRVSGILGFEFPGTVERPASRLEGAFEAKMCRLALESR